MYNIYMSDVFLWKIISNREWEGPLRLREDLPCSMQLETHSQTHPCHPQQEVSTLGLHTSRDRVGILGLHTQGPLQLFPYWTTAVQILKNRTKE